MVMALTSTTSRQATGAPLEARRALSSRRQRREAPEAEGDYAHGRVTAACKTAAI